MGFQDSEVSVIIRRKDALTQERVQEVLGYNPNSGKFARRDHYKGLARSGKEPGTISQYGYRVIGVDWFKYLAHRLAWLHVHGCWPENEIDHINGDRLDNRIDNLREATHAENGQNAKMWVTNTSGFKGVYYCKGQRGYKQWKAEFSSNGKMIRVGYFKTKEEAGEAIKIARAEYHGEFANHGA